MSSTRHLTTRRSFVAAMGFGGVSLYALWVAYGAAPGPLSLLGGGDHADDAPSAGDGDHDATADDTATAEFRRLTSEFVERYRLPDGSVHPRRLVPGTAPATDHDTSSAAMAGHDHGHAPAAPAEDSDNGHAHGSDDPIDVYLLAEKWSYEPAQLRLDAGVAYRFRMMAADISHGASIQFGRGGRMIRLRPGTVAEMMITFEKPGRHLVYCTVYCGPGHDLMQARIEVV